MHLNLLSYNFYRHDGDYKPEKGETAKKNIMGQVHYNSFSYGTTHYYHHFFLCAIPMRPCPYRGYIKAHQTPLICVSFAVPNYNLI